MAFVAGEWNAIVVGAWNPAGLTPSGMRHHLLGVGREVPLFVELNVEQAQPPRVRHDGISLYIMADGLVAGPEVPDVGNMRRATEALRRGLDRLNQTPVRAAGVNFRYVEDDPNVLLDERRCALDELLDGRATIVARGLRRSIEMLPGVLNLEIREETGRLFADLNFHFDSPSHEDLSAWLGRVEEFHTYGATLLEDLGVHIGERP